MTRTGSSPLHAVGVQFCENFEFWCAVGILGVAWLYYPYCQSGPDFCVCRKLFGFSCPGCGLTRGVCFLVHGRLAQAVQFNPLSLLAVAILLSNVLFGMWKLLRGDACRLFEFEGRLKSTVWSGEPESLARMMFSSVRCGRAVVNAARRRSRRRAAPEFNHDMI